MPPVSARVELCSTVLVQPDTEPCDVVRNRGTEEDNGMPLNDEENGRWVMFSCGFMFVLEGFVKGLCFWAMSASIHRFHVTNPAGCLC